MEESDLEILKVGNENSEFISKNIDKLEKKHKGKIIAIKKCKVIAEAKNMSSLLKKVEKEGISHISIISIPSQKAACILLARG